MKKVGDTKYQVTDISEFDHHPSRNPIYDSQSREVSISRRFQKIYNIIARLGFSPSTSNLGEKFEQVFIYDVVIDGDNCCLNLRLQPNLFVKIDYFCWDGQRTVYRGYFEYKRVYASLTSINFNYEFIQMCRDLIIDDILS